MVRVDGIVHMEVCSQTERRTSPVTDKTYFEPISADLLSDNWGTLTRHRYRLKLRDGSWEEQTREAYDRGDGAACLLHDPAADTVLLVRQFRLPALVAGDDDPFLIEVPAGLLDEDDPVAQMIKELEEETGYRPVAMWPVYQAFMSPGSVTERLTLFAGTYDSRVRVGEGGGRDDEGEDIETLHVPVSEASEMIRSGRIRDGKTIMLIQHLLLARVEGGD